MFMEKALHPLIEAFGPTSLDNDFQSSRASTSLSDLTTEDVHVLVNVLRPVIDVYQAITIGPLHQQTLSAASIYLQSSISIINNSDGGVGAAYEVGKVEFDPAIDLFPDAVNELVQAGRLQSRRRIQTSDLFTLRELAYVGHASRAIVLIVLSISNPHSLER